MHYFSYLEESKDLLNFRSSPIKEVDIQLGQPIPE